MNPELTRALTGTSQHPELTFTRTYRASAEDVRDALTDVERLSRWFGRIEGAPARVGDPFTAYLSEDPEDVAQGRVLQCEPAVIVAWSWQGERESTITARWRAAGEGLTEVTLHHALAEPEHATGYGGGWEQTLQALARSLDSVDDAVPADGQIEADAIAQWRTLSRAPLEVEHRIAAPIERVWHAIASADGLKTWWWRHWDDVEISADVVLDGEYRIHAPGAGMGIEGRYLIVEEPHRLAFTWRWLDDGEVVPDEAVDIRLTPDGDETVLALRHSGPWIDDAPADSYREGWAFTLGELQAVLGS